MTNKIADRRPIVRLALNKSELALSIGISTGSVDLMVEEGALPRPRMWHSRRLWLVSEVEAYLTALPVEGGDKPRLLREPKL
jgi:predicted DNA-binding transcriptional regulator AlpA